AVAGAGERAGARAPRRRARLPDHADLPLARSRRPAPAPGEVPHPLRRAAALRGRPERRGRRDRGARRGGEAADPRADRRGARRAPQLVLVTRRPRGGLRLRPVRRQELRRPVPRLPRDAPRAPGLPARDPEPPRLAALLDALSRPRRRRGAARLADLLLGEG